MSYAYGAPPQNPWVTPGWVPRDPGAWALFQRVDVDRSGTVRLEELLQALTNGGFISFSARTARYLMRMYDADRSGVLQYIEFEQLIGQVIEVAYIIANTYYSTDFSLWCPAVKRLERPFQRR